LKLNAILNDRSGMIVLWHPASVTQRRRESKAAKKSLRLYFYFASYVKKLPRHFAQPFPSNLSPRFPFFIIVSFLQR
jgi:hypothetical protein